MKKSILNLEDYGVTELSYSEYQSTNGGRGLAYRLGQLVGHIVNVFEATSATCLKVANAKMLAV